jgi:hypothetical protein
MSDKKLKKLTDYIEKLVTGSFEHWDQSEINGYFTALLSISVKIEEIFEVGLHTKAKLKSIPRQESNDTKS